MGHENKNIYIYRSKEVGEMGIVNVIHFGIFNLMLSYPSLWYYRPESLGFKMRPECGASKHVSSFLFLLFKLFQIRSKDTHTHTLMRDAQ